MVLKASKSLLKKRVNNFELIIAKQINPFILKKSCQLILIPFSINNIRMKWARKREPKGKNTLTIILEIKSPLPDSVEAKKT